MPGIGQEGARFQRRRAPRPGRWPRNAKGSGAERGDLAIARMRRYTIVMKKTHSKSSGRVLERILEPVSSSLNDEAARKLISLRADAASQSRIAELADKCNEGQLTDDERDEYEAYVMAGEFVAILQAQAPS